MRQISLIPMQWALILQGTTQTLTAGVRTLLFGADYSMMELFAVSSADLALSRRTIGLIWYDNLYASIMLEKKQN